MCPAFRPWKLNNPNLNYNLLKTITGIFTVWLFCRRSRYEIPYRSRYSLFITSRSRLISKRDQIHQDSSRFWTCAKLIALWKKLFYKKNFKYDVLKSDDVSTTNYTFNCFKRDASLLKLNRVYLFSIEINFAYIKNLK